MNRFFLGAYWLARREPIDACADRLVRFLGELVTCDPLVAHWYKLGRSRKQALQNQVDIHNRAILLELLDRGRHWTDSDNRLMEDIGFSVALWNGEVERTSSQLTITCGGYSEFLVNRVVLRLPIDLGSLARADQMANVVTAATTAWEPDWAGVMSEDAFTTRNWPMHEPFVDWLLYLSQQWLPVVPPLPPHASTRSGASGTLIIVQEHPPDPANHVDIERIRAVDAALRRVWRVPND